LLLAGAFGVWADAVPDDEIVEELAGCVWAALPAEGLVVVTAAKRDAARAAALCAAAARAAACSRSEAAVRTPEGVPPADSVAEVPGSAIGEVPRKETIALATTNRIAAPATRDPAVPNPATYARVARISTSDIGMRRGTFSDFFEFVCHT
jgi:hypothetical protein